MKLFLSFFTNVRNPLIIIIIIGTALLFAGCKKDKLEGDKEVLIGKWKWTHSIRTVYAKPPGIYETLTPHSESATYAIEFLKKGKVRFIENARITEENRIVFTNWPDCHGAYVSIHANCFSINLNNRKEKVFNGIVDRDSLLIRGYFPFSDDQATPAITNYFIRE